MKSPRVSATSSFIDSSAQDLLQRSLHLFGRTTNFSAAVDVDTVDRLSTQAQTTRAKEAWKFSRVGLTNTFTRTRFAPVSGREIIESTNYFGGRLLVGPSSVSMPVDASLPGFEMLNHLRNMLAAGPALERREGESTVMSATLRSGQTLKAWFHDGCVVPSRIEKHQGGNLVFAITRAEGRAGNSLLPQGDSLHFYENGRVTTTVLRSFSNIRELPEQLHEASAQPSQK